MSEILDYAYSRKIMLDKKALFLLEKRLDFKELIDSFFSKGVFSVNEQDVEKAILEDVLPSGLSLKEQEECSFSEKKSFRILSDRDISFNTTSEGTVDDFRKMFLDKYEKLKKILVSRHLGSPRLINSISKSDSDDIEIIAMVRSKHLSGSGNLILTLDDPTGSTKVIATKKNKELFDSARKILDDNVLFFRLKKVRQFIFLQDFFYPSIENLPSREGGDINILNISDTHIGSKNFMKKEFNKFIDWINCKNVSDEEKQEIQKIKYIIISGDNIDGIGVYPNQYDNLEITDVFEQYELFSDYILQIPERIEIFICPGQHDAVRRADPQPAIDKKYVPKLFEKPNIHFIGSPSWLEIEGFKVLVYHGASLHALIELESDVDFTQPAKAFSRILERRDIMTGFGISNPYAPNKTDYMVLDIRPDIVYLGDFHHKDFVQHKGVFIINSGTWQTQTDFEIKIGHVPTPGFCSLFNLQTKKLKYIDFNSDKE